MTPASAAQPIVYNGIPFYQIQTTDPRFQKPFPIFINPDKQIIFFSGLFTHQVLNLFWDTIEFDKTSDGDFFRNLLGDKSYRYRNYFNPIGLYERGYFNHSELPVVAMFIRKLIGEKQAYLQTIKCSNLTSDIANEIIDLEKMASRVIVASEMLRKSI